ncbi:SRPBCC family protein [Tenacibaculum sp. nBUS_03]|uniref:SRPBCC family protein n=1 Tax=Tenacibaculum sp. nBUS_03 TaxID=3395320 RepID=UPI003EBC4812
MKKVKIILGIIITLSIAFFATGVIIKELNYESKVTINKPIEEVFALFNNDNNLSKWIPEIKSVKVKNKVDGIVGSTFAVTVLNQGQEMTLEEKVLAFEQNKNIKLLFVGGGMRKTDDYLFENKEGKTIVILKANCKSTGFILGCMLPFVKGKLQNQDQQYLTNFKEFVEKE